MKDVFEDRNNFVGDHCVKIVQIRSYFWSVFSCIRTEYRKIRTRNKSVSGHFSRSMPLSTFDKMFFHPELLLSFRLANDFSDSWSVNSDP